jgi:hypothetical protein
MACSGTALPLYTVLRHGIVYWLLLRGGIVQSVPCNCEHLMIYSAPHLNSNHSWFIHQSSLLSGCSRNLVAKRGETGREIDAEICLSVSLPYLKKSLTCREVLRHGADGFTSPPKEAVLRIFIALKNPSLSAGFEPANRGSNSNHDNHYTIQNDTDKYRWQSCRKIQMQSPCIVQSFVHSNTHCYTTEQNCDWYLFLNLRIWYWTSAVEFHAEERSIKLHWSGVNSSCGLTLFCCANVQWAKWV